MIDNTRGGVWGPYTALMQIPDLAGRVASVGEHLRFNGVLPGAERELAILCSAKENNSRFEWAVHAPVAREEGLRADLLEYLRSGKETKFSQREKMIVEIVRSLNRKKTIAESLYREAEALFTAEELVEIVTICGFYQMLAYVISAFDVPEPDSDIASF